MTYGRIFKIKRYFEALSNQFHKEIESYIRSWSNEMDVQSVTISYPNGQSDTFKQGEIMRHVIAHEIHHIGQLSVWASELGREPVTANVISRGLFE
ncbi:hypothetical protein E1I69_08960 [Bacillus timonensis]|uniref:DinB family protein n=1 Tax=Bacillus timonensis TaxID=1033734 RepID=A0A4S3PU33_9BACI|nr:DinB family protein [Bacillus timonensis]THE12994.1 hypothetical protein E1I69_08960 [Bacillus timonensis]